MSWISDYITGYPKRYRRWSKTIRYKKYLAVHKWCSSNELHRMDIRYKLTGMHSYSGSGCLMRWYQCPNRNKYRFKRGRYCA